MNQSLYDVFDLGEDRYTAQVVPGCFPHERQPVLANWSTEEREMWCGEYTPQRRYDLRSSFFALQVLRRHGRA